MSGARAGPGRGRGAGYSSLAPGVHRALAPAKINLGLFLGPVRDSDGRHELVSVMQSISLADEVTLEAAPAGSDTDEVVCPGVLIADGENLAATALRAFRASTGWRAPPLRLSIVSGSPSPPAWGEARLTPRLRCAWPGTRRGLATSSCCAHLARSSGLTCPRRYRRGAG